MFFDRVAAKQQAKQTVRIRRPSPVLVTLVFILLTTGVSSLVNLFASNPFVEAMMYIRQGYDPIDVYAVVFGTSTSALLIFISILMGLYSAIMSFGYQGYLLRLSRGGEAGVFPPPASGGHAFPKGGVAGPWDHPLRPDQNLWGDCRPGGQAQGLPRGGDGQ